MKCERLLALMQSDKRPKITAAVIVAAALLTAVLTTAGHAFADTGNGLVVPMYGWDSGWGTLIDAKEKNRDTEIIAIINPSNGPGVGRDSHWTNVINDLQGADIKVVGYVATGYAGKSADAVKYEVNAYHDWYGVDGIFFDEVSPSNEEYYNNVVDGAGLTILNPGAPVPKSYENIGDIIIVNENAGLPQGVDSNGISESQLGVLSHSGIPNENEFKAITDQVDYVYGAPDWMSVAPNIADQANWAN